MNYNILENRVEKYLRSEYTIISHLITKIANRAKRNTFTYYVTYCHIRYVYVLVPLYRQKLTLTLFYSFRFYS